MVVLIAKFVIFLLVTIFPSIFYAEVKNLPSFVSRDRFTYVDITFPTDMEFFLNKLSKPIFGVNICEPFILKDRYLTDMLRYGIDRYPFVSIIVLSYFAPFSKELFELTPENLKKKGVVILEEAPKTYKAKGLLLKIKENTYFSETDFIKWAAIFGNSIQTIIVVAVYPEYLDQNLSSTLRRIVEYADYGLPQADPNGGRKGNKK